MTEPVELLDTRLLAEGIDIKPATVRAYLHRGWLPEPDYRLGQSPVWLGTTIDAWLEAGRPKRKP